MEHIIIYIHGFGMKKDDRGLLTGIASIFTDSINILTDMNTIDEERQALIVEPITKQVEVMNNVFKDLQDQYPGIRIDVIAHSQGCVITTLIKDIHIASNIIFLAPSFDFDRERIANTFRGREGSIINFDGLSTFIRRDGSTTYVPKEYWVDREQYNPIKLFSNLSTNNTVHIILAKDDDVVRNESISEFKNNPNIHIQTIPGNHNFDGDAREGLLNEIKKILL